MHDEDKCQRCYRICLSWYNESFEDLCKKRSSDSSFRREFDKADGVLSALEDGEAPNWDHPMSVRTTKRTGMKLEAPYYFMSVSEFTRKYKVEPKHAGLKVVTIDAEDGCKQIQGILFKWSPGAERYRKITFFTETTWSMEETLLTPESRLRQKEPVETFEAVNKAKAKKNPVAGFKTGPD